MVMAMNRIVTSWSYYYYGVLTIKKVLNRVYGFLAVPVRLPMAL